MLCIEYLNGDYQNGKQPSQSPQAYVPKMSPYGAARDREEPLFLAGMEDALGEQPETHDLSLATPQSWALTSAENQWEAGIY